MSIHAIGIVGLVLVFLIGTWRPMSLGALSLVATFLVGTIFVGEGVGAMYSGFPVALLVVLAGVTYLFGIATCNGTIEFVVERSARLVEKRRALIPWIVFVLASLPAMAGALGSAGVAMLAPFSLRLAERCDIDRRMMGLMVIYGAGAGNFSPLNVLGVIVTQAVEGSGLEMSSTALFLANIAYNVALGAVIYVIFGGLRLLQRGEANSHVASEAASLTASSSHGDGNPKRLGVDQGCTLLALVGVAVAALAFDLNIGFLAFAAAVALHLLFPSSSAGGDKKIAWDVVLLVCGIVTYVAALQRYGTVEAVGDSIAGLNSPLTSSLLICAVGAVTSAFASSAGILGAMIPLAVPFMAGGDIGTTGLVVALAISATAVDATPFSTVGALVVANARDQERQWVYRGLLAWGAAMIVTAPLLTWLMFVVPIN